MAGFYHFTESNTERYIKSGNTFYCLKNPNIELYDANSNQMKVPHKPIIIDIEEISPAFVVPFEAWNNGYFDFNVGDKIINIVASNSYPGFDGELIVAVVIAEGR